MQARSRGAILGSCPFPSNTVMPCCLPIVPAISGTITTVVTEVLAANPETTPLDIESALRAAFRQAYLVANSTPEGFEIVRGMLAWHAALADAGVTVEQNWAALTTRK
jgi:hypothetical protein